MRYFSCRKLEEIETTMSTLNVRLLSAGYKLCKHRLAAAPPYINQQLRVVSIFFFYFWAKKWICFSWSVKLSISYSTGLRLMGREFNTMQQWVASFENSSDVVLRRSFWQRITGKTSLFIDFAAGCLIDTSCYLTAVHLSFYCPGSLRGTG